jgi:protein-S-isoprenylcysteine O-methyltransferase Ste14
MTLVLAKLIWGLGVIAWFVIRYPHQRRSRRTPSVAKPSRTLEYVLLSVSFTGLFVIPFTYVLTDQPSVANYQFQPWLAWLGLTVFVGSLWLFRRTHNDLGRNWSVTLEIRAAHTLITTGVYRHVRHPMYSAFWMWAVAQAMLLPNWFAGPAGLVGFGILFFGRIGREEQLMAEAFGDDYRQYARRTSLIIPGIF